MKRRYLWIGGAVLAVALVATAVQAKGHRGRQHHGGHRFEALDLSQAQKDQMRKLMTENRKQMIQLRADTQVARLELAELLRQKSPDTKAVDRAIEKVNAANAKVTESRARQKLSINRILTDEQLQKLEDMPKRRRGHGPMHNRRGGRGDRRGHGMGMGWAPTPDAETGSQI